MNISKINEHILKEHTKTLENILTNISIHYNINKKELFEKFLYTKYKSKKYKNKKKTVDPQYICMAKIKSGCQCSRSKKFGDYCGKHSIHNNMCPLKGYVSDSKRSKKEEEEYIKNKVFQCSCKPKLGIISQENINEVSEHKINSNHLIVKNEHLQGKTYHVESDTQIVFDTNIKKPTVIGKKLSDNKIFFLSDIPTEHVEGDVPIEPIIKSKKCHDSSNNNERVQTLNNISNNISNLLNKHNVGHLEESFNNFNINNYTDMTDKIDLYTNEIINENIDEDNDILADINAELGLY